MKIKNKKLRYMIERAITLPVIVTPIDTIIHCIYAILACALALPIICAFIVLNTEIFYYMTTQNFIKLGLVMLVDIVLEFILWSVRNYILNYDMKEDVETTVSIEANKRFK